MFHPDLNYDMARLRHRELVAGPGRRSGHRFRFRRRPKSPVEDEPAPPARHLTVVRAPDAGGDKFGRDPRVA
jgi:hypothetical protein